MLQLDLLRSLIMLTGDVLSGLLKKLDEAQ